MKLNILKLSVLFALFNTSACNQESPPPVPKTATIYATADASIFNSTATPGQYNDYGNGGSDMLRVGNVKNNYVDRTLLSFDVSSIEGFTVDSAKLSLTIAKGGTSILPISVYKLTESWTEGTTDEGCLVTDACTIPGILITGADVSWSHATFNTAAWSTSGGTFASTASATSSKDFSLYEGQGITDDVKAWVANSASNFGWILKIDEASVLNTGGEHLWYYSREASLNGAAETTQPTLTVYYH